MEVIGSAIFFVIGAIVGSFGNVLILRFGFLERQNPRSACMHCENNLRWFELVPIVSYIALRGRCSRCGTALLTQYPLVELLLGSLYAGAFLSFTPEVSFASLVAFAGLLTFLLLMTIVVVYDIRHTLIPLPFVYGSALAAAVYRSGEALQMQNFMSLIDAGLGALVLFGIFAALSLATRGRGMGFGDAHVGGSIGILLGLFDGITAVILGVWSATIVYLFLLIGSRFPGLQKYFRVTMKSELPFAPWLGFGCVLVLYTNLSALGLITALSNALWGM